MATFKNTTINDTGYLRLPVGTTAEQPTGQVGMLRYNTTKNLMEFYDGAQWIGIGEYKAQGGTETSSGGYRIHTFTSPGDFTVLGGTKNVEVLMVGGGGAGGGGTAGGGGAGELKYASALSTSQGTYAVSIGTGGVSPQTFGGGSNFYGRPGNASSFGNVASAVGGGGGGAGGNDDNSNGRPGGSGGGGSVYPSFSGPAGGSATASSSGGFTGYGNPGGNCNAPGGGGGGGAANAGSTGPSGPGGNGRTYSISGSSVTYAGGGGGSQGGSGGSGGGGNGTSAYAQPGATNTGGGGGGGWDYGSGGGGAGGPGIVIVRYAEE